MQVKEGKKKYLDLRNFKLIYDYYAYIFYLQGKKQQKQSLNKFNVLKFFSIKFNTETSQKSIVSQSFYTVIYLNFFTLFDLIKLKLPVSGNETRIKDIFNQIIFEKRMLLSKKSKGRDIGVVESFLRITFSKGIFIPSAWINLTSFYLQYNLYFNWIDKWYSGDFKIVIGFLMACVVSLPFKNLQYETLYKMNNESVLLKDFFKIFNLNYLRSGFIKRYNIQLKETMPSLFFDNFIGITFFFCLIEKLNEGKYIEKYLFDQENDELYSNEDIINEISQENHTIRRSIIFSKLEVENSEKRIKIISNEFITNLLAGFITATIVTPIELVAKYYLGEFAGLDSRKKFTIWIMYHKVNYLKFIFQYGICLSFLKSYEQINFHNSNNKI